MPPNWDINFRRGLLGEVFAKGVIETLDRPERCEVKTDDQAARTGNLYVEYQCLLAAGWSNSGIRITEADYWTFVLSDKTILVTIPTHVLRELCIKAKAARRIAEETDGSHPTRGYLIPLSQILKWRER